MTFNPGEKTKGSFDPKTLAEMLKGMDQDIATRFVASALSLDIRKIKEAYALAQDEMYLREQERKRQSLAQKGKTSAETVDEANEKLKKSTKALVDTIQELLKPYGLEEVEIKIDNSDPKKDDKDK